MDINIDKKIFDKVVFVGPDRKGLGGIASVLSSYSTIIKPFHCLSTNSRYGLINGLINFSLTMLGLPIQRIKGRKILHIHHACAKSLPRKAIIARWGRILGFKIILHCHGGAIVDYASKIGVNKVTRMLKTAHVNVVLSKTWQKNFANVFGIYDTVTINNIIETPSTSISAHGMQKGETLKLVFLGRLVRDKGIHELLEAISIIKSEGLPVLLTICGDGDVDSINALIQSLNIGDLIHFVGWVNAKERESILERSNCLILPSYYEGIPICILEAMSMGLAIIATKVGGVPDIVTNKKNGLLVKSHDVNEIVNSIRTLINNPYLVEKFGIENITKAEAFYPENVKNQLTELYRQIL